jgi:hypothetical protein
MTDAPVRIQLSRRKDTASVKRQRDLERALLAMFLDAEQLAVNGHETCTYPGGVFDDAIWRRAEPDMFKIAATARRLLGLRPFKYRHKTRFGGASDALEVFRHPPRAGE